MLHKTVEKNRSRKNIDEGMKDFLNQLKALISRQTKKYQMMWQFNAMQTILKQILRYNSEKMNSKIRAKKLIECMCRVQKNSLHTCTE